MMETNSWVSGEWELGKTVTGLYGANLKEGEWWTDYYWYTHKNGGKWLYSSDLL